MTVPKLKEWKHKLRDCLNGLNALQRVGVDLEQESNAVWEVITDIDEELAAMEHAP